MHQLPGCRGYTANTFIGSWKKRSSNTRFLIRLGLLFERLAQLLAAFPRALAAVCALAPEQAEHGEQDVDANADQSCDLYITEAAAH